MKTSTNTISLSYSKRTLPVGILLGALCFILLIAEGRKLGYAFGGMMIVGFCIISVVRIRTDSKWISAALNIAWAFSMAIVTLLWTLFSIYLKPRVLFDIASLNIVLNIVIFFCIVCLALIIFADWKKAVSIASILLFGLAVAGWLVWEFRGKQLIFSDIYAAKTAMNVVAQYSLQVNVRAAIGISLWLFFFCLQFCIPGIHCASSIRLRIISLLSCAALMAFIYLGSINMSTLTWYNYGYTRNGFFLNYFLSTRDSFISEPDGYSPKAIHELESRYSSNEAAQEQSLPNIIVIMNESFADLSQLGDKFKTNVPVTPFFDSLTENTIRGYAYSSVFGGGTANSEYEALTGNSTAMLPSGSTPYEQYIKTELYSLPMLLKEYGYSTFATHPFDSTGWNRTIVYPLLGFDACTFREDYPNKTFVRHNISDQEMYEYILAKLDKSDDRLFLFGVTMQNHGSYDVADFPASVRLKDYSAQYDLTEQYMTLINNSDTALEYLISELEKRDDKNLVLFFGDHLPKIEEEFYEETHSGNFTTLDEQMLRQKVPFIIWANYDIEEQYVAETSLSYLGCYLLEAAGIQLPPYFQFLKDLEEHVPVITALGYKSKAVGGFIEINDARGDEKVWLNDYAILQYNNLFDSKNKSEFMFGS